MHDVALVVAGLVVLLLQLRGVAAAAATGEASANQHAQSLRRSKVRAACCVRYTTERYQGLVELSEGCCAGARLAGGRGRHHRPCSGRSYYESFDEDKRGSTWFI
jgi:hypothetical protein